MNREYHKNYYLENKDKINAQRRKHYKKNRDRIVVKQRIYNKTYRDKNKEKRHTYMKIYRQKHKEVLAEKNKIRCRKHYGMNKEKYKIFNRDYHQKNKKKVREMQNKYKFTRYHNDPSFRLREAISSNIRQRLYYFNSQGYNKPTTTVDYLGCSIKKLKAHLENQFQEEMSWDTYGLYGWHIDHIVPCALFDLTKLSEQKKCFHYTNLQPLWAHDNLSKGDKLEV